MPTLFTSTDAQVIDGNDTIPGGTTITGNLLVDGNLTVDGNVTVNGSLKKNRRAAAKRLERTRGGQPLVAHPRRKRPRLDGAKQPDGEIRHGPAGQIPNPPGVSCQAAE